jgi:hypothetical protein
MSGQPRKQHYGFAHHILRQLAFERPDETVELLRGPRAAGFLGAVWENARKVAAELGDTTVYDAAPTATPRQFGALLGAVVTMPRAERMTEAYYIALVSSQSTAFADTPAIGGAIRAYFHSKGEAALKYYTLEWTLTDRSVPSAVLCAWDASGTHANFQTLVEPNEAAFLAAVTPLATRGPS